MKKTIAENNPLRHSDSLVAHFKYLYRDLMLADLDKLSEIYAEDAVFVDPVHEVHGLDSLQAYISEMCRNLTFCRFEYLDRVISDGDAYIKWNMHFSHQKLGAKTIKVRGVSHIQFQKTIVYHEDIYDMGAMLYEHVPVIGMATSWLKRRLAV